VNEALEKELDERSFENLVWFYRDELTSLRKGASARDLFPKGLRKRLLNLGVLVYRHGRSGLRYFVSSAAAEILRGIIPTPLK
jgi:hypothetical protein